MKIKKISEVVDSSGELIGSNAVPEHGSDLETRANNTTDYNMSVGSQKFKYNSMAMMGFNMIPFYEGQEDQETQKQQELLTDLSELMHDRFVDIIGHYYRNPNKLKPDYRKIKEGDHSEESIKYDNEWAIKVVKVIEKHYENAFKNVKKLDEDFVMKEKVDTEFAKKYDNKELSTKKLNNIAGLLNKLDKKDLKKIVDLLEAK